MRDCNGCDNVETDEGFIECDGEFVSDKCIEVEEGVPFLGISQHTPLSVFIKKITKRVKLLALRVGNFWNLPEHTDDVDASNGGVAVGSPYVTPSGVVRIRKN